MLLSLACSNFPPVRYISQFVEPFSFQVVHFLFTSYKTSSIIRKRKILSHILLHQNHNEMNIDMFTIDYLYSSFMIVINDRKL